ncbi:unnamed protein product [Microthlaspi erraticum]|uniref:S1 motif domain-containing protein n=1 Tax=Microthlaspi erraticum TaxID=1685480 RepID=A0A6D2IN72_9BRAS|nr:unnamed protein product [Microthlaspi erraticum]
MVMRKLELPLSQTQKVRFQTAIERLQSPAEGHGTSEVDDELLATVCGVVVRVDKLVYVRTLRARYKPQVGDIVVGRVIEVAQTRWRVDLNFTQDSFINMHDDNVQKRRTSVDELNMRNIFAEDDVVCAEVGEFHKDGSLILRVRSQKHGKLDKGQLLKVDPYLVKRIKPQFHYIESLGIDLILGCNGFIWVGEHGHVRDPMTKNTRKEQSHTPLETRQTICRIGNAIQVLSNLGFTMTLEVIMETFKLSNTRNIDIHDMLGSEFHVLVTENEAERRHG